MDAGRVGLRVRTDHTAGSRRSWEKQKGLALAQTGDELRRARKGRSRWSQVGVASAFEAGGGKGKMPREVG